MTTTTQRVILVVSKVSGASASTITADTTFDELDLDSLDRFEFLIELEGEFGVDLENDLAHEWACVKDAVKHLESLA